MSVGGCPSDTHTHTIPAGENQKKTFCTEFNIFRQRGWRRGRRVGGVGAFSVFFLSLIFTQSEVWTHLEAEQTGAAAKAARHINASFSFFLSVGKVEIDQCDRVKGIRRRWEVEITCYYPFGKLQQSDISITHNAFCWVYPLQHAVLLPLCFWHFISAKYVTILSVSLICMFPCTLQMETWQITLQLLSLCWDRAVLPASSAVTVAQRFFNSH